jgi:hypothetical protein
MEVLPESMDKGHPCPRCGEGIEKGSRFCKHCGKSFAGNKRFLSANWHLLAGAGLILAGVLVFFWIHSLKSGEVGNVNGESITREEFSKRMDRAKKFSEYRYGQAVFQGAAGKDNLDRLKQHTLDEMVNEKLLLQEAKSARYMGAPEEEITEEFETIKKKHSLSDAELSNIFGGSIEDFKADLRKGWIISQFVEKVVLKGNQANEPQLYSKWLTQVKAKSKIETYETRQTVPVAKASCCSSGGGGCGGSGRARPLDPQVEAEATSKALGYYEKKTRRKGATARVTDFGCHIQVDIIEGGKVVVSLTYRGGEVQEI